jgi:hypothetical protein
MVAPVCVKVDMDIKTRQKEALAECRAWAKDFAKTLK